MDRDNSAGVVATNLVLVEQRRRLPWLHLTRTAGSSRTTGTGKDLDQSGQRQRPVLLNQWLPDDSFVRQFTPAAEVEITAPMRHVVHFFDSANSRRKTKPAGVKFCEIVMFVGDAEPESIELYQNVGVTSKSSYTISFDTIDVGKTAWYRFRWTNPRGEAGPWSTAYNCTVAE